LNQSIISRGISQEGKDFSMEMVLWGTGKDRFFGGDGTTGHKNKNKIGISK